MDSTHPRTSPPYGWAAIVSAAVLAIYVATLGPTTAFWDTSEYIAAAKVLGIPHPPGNPLFVLTAHVWGLIPMVSDYATRINLFAAVTSALSAGLWFLVADRWMRSVVTFRPARLAAAFAGTLLGSTMWTVWNQSTVNEKVYTLSLLSMALVMWLAVHWADDKPGAHRDRWVILIAYVIALSSTNHQMGVLARPRRGGLHPDDRLAGHHPVARADRRRPRGRRRHLDQLPLPADPCRAFSADQRGRADRLLQQRPLRGARSGPVRQALGLRAPGGSRLPGRATTSSIGVGSSDATGPPSRRVLTIAFSAIGLTGLMTLLQKDRRAGLAALTLFATLTAGAGLLPQLPVRLLDRSGQCHPRP